MGKKKNRGPERACAKCSKKYHARRRECPHCGAAAPRSAKKAVKKVAAMRAGRTTKPVDTLDLAIRYVESAGGFKEAKAALEKIERIKSL